MAGLYSLRGLFRILGFSRRGALEERAAFGADAALELHRRFARSVGFGRGFILFGPLNALAAEADLALFSVDPEHLHLDLVAHIDDVLRVLDLLVRQLRDMKQAL